MRRLGRDERHRYANRVITRYLLEKGFVEQTPRQTDGHPRELVAFEGPLPGTTPPIPIRIEILDWDFIKYPRIMLLADPEEFRPHVDGLGCLCYLGPGAVVFDRLQPLDNLEHCLSVAAQELTRQGSPDYRHAESRYEFARYWSGGVYRLLGTIRPAKPLHRTQFGFIGERQFLVSDDLDEISKIRRAILQEKDKTHWGDQVYPAWVITLRVDPWLDRNGPPDTWAKLWSWIDMVDPRGAARLRSVVDGRDFAKSDLGVIVFRYATKFFGVMTSIPPEIRESRALVKFQRGAASAIGDYLRNCAGSRIEVITFEAMEVGEEFIYRRNLQTPHSLGGLKVHLVGAGAIGGFLAQLLTRLGAGTAGGELRIVDPEILGSENVGRHLLGIDALLQSKAMAVADFLTRQFPMSNIQGEFADALQVPNLFDCDLLIDATGEEALSLVLNEMHREHLVTNPAATPTMLFSWVLGNGEVVQCLLSDGGNHACYDCLNLPDREGLERQRFPILKERPETKLIGCHTMRPYAVTAPTTAAALAAQMIADWKDGRPEPRFRTLYLSRGSSLHNIKGEADPERLSGCLTCSRT